MAVTSKPMRPTAPDSTSTEGRRVTTIEWLTPAWGRRVAAQVESYVAFSPGIAFLSAILALITLGIGVGLLLGDGFATIQGVRYTLRALGLAIRTDTWPSAPWWTIQVVLVIIQIFGKKLKAFRPLWTPSYIFNATTTSVFLAIGLGQALGIAPGLPIGPDVFRAETLVPTILVAGIAAFAGHILALGAEQVAMTGLCMIGAVYSGLFSTSK